MNRSLRFFRSFVPAVLMVIAIGAFAYVMFERLGRVEERLIEVNRQTAQVSVQTQAAAEAAARAVLQSETAVARASEAERAARDAALGRDRAESEAAQARTAEAEASEDAERARDELERFEQERRAELDRLERALGQIAETRRTALGVVMSLGSDSIEFDFDRASLGTKERELLSRIAGILLTSTGYSIQVYGHTDDVGTERYNQLLSERRAESVRDYLVEAGIDPSIIETKGYGKSSPRVAGNTEEARATNRRVEIAVIDVRLDYERSTEP